MARARRNPKSIPLAKDLQSEHPSVREQREYYLAILREILREIDVRARRELFAPRYVDVSDIVRVLRFAAYFARNAAAFYVVQHGLTGAAGAFRTKTVDREEEDGYLLHPLYPLKHITPDTRGDVFRQRIHSGSPSPWNFDRLEAEQRVKAIERYTETRVKQLERLPPGEYANRHSAQLWKKTHDSTPFFVAFRSLISQARMYLTGDEDAALRRITSAWVLLNEAGEAMEQALFSLGYKTLGMLVVRATDPRVRLSSRTVIPELLRREVAARRARNA